MHCWFGSARGRGLGRGTWSLCLPPMTLPASCVSSDETEAVEEKRCRGYECEHRGERRERVEEEEEGECGEEKRKKKVEGDQHEGEVKKKPGERR